MQFRPSAYTRPPGEQAHAFAAIAERQHEQPRPAIFATLRITHHRPTAIVDLGFFSRSGEDDAHRFPTLRPAQLAHKTLHRLIAPGKAVVRDQVLPDRLAIASQGQALFDEFSVRFTGASDGRFCWDALPPETRQPYNNAGRLQVGAGCFSTHTSGLLDAPQGPSELP